VIGIGHAYGAYSYYGWYSTTDFGGVVDATIAGYRSSRRLGSHAAPAGLDTGGTVGTRIRLP